MIQPAPVLRVSPQQCAQLLSHLKTYRSYLWQCVMPTPERNQIIHTIQMMQGRLEPEQQGRAEVLFPMSHEEGRIVQQIFGGLIHLYATTQREEQRLHLLGEIANLRVLVERALRPTGALNTPNRSRSYVFAQEEGRRWQTHSSPQQRVLFLHQQCSN